MKRIFLKTFLAFYFVISPFVHFHPGTVHYENGNSVIVDGAIDFLNFSEGNNSSFDYPSVSSNKFLSAPEVKSVGFNQRIEKKKNSLQANYDSFQPSTNSSFWRPDLLIVVADKKSHYKVQSSLSPPSQV